jgi:Activator of Hsp90 ATPase homolog 1-like protein
MINQSVFLPVTVTRAFDLFTLQIGQWWPADRRHLNDPGSELFLLETGRFYERAVDGTELDLGRVRLWQSPHRIVLDFFIGTDAAHPTQVDIRFVAEADGARVTVTHQPTETSAHLWDMRAPLFERSWDAVLKALRAAITL